LNHVDQVDWEERVSNLKNEIEFSKHGLVLGVVVIHVAHAIVHVQEAVVVNEIVLNAVN